MNFAIDPDNSSCFLFPFRVRVNGVLLYSQEFLMKTAWKLMGEPEIAKMALDRENDHTRRKNKHEEIKMECFDWELFLMNLFGRKSQRNPLSTFSKIQLVVSHQCCVLIGWATTRLYVIAHWLRKAPAFWRQKRIKV